MGYCEIHMMIIL